MVGMDLSRAKAIVDAAHLDTAIVEGGHFDGDGNMHVSAMTIYMLDASSGFALVPSNVNAGRLGDIVVYNGLEGAKSSHYSTSVVELQLK
jgi:hypothetical protein